MQAVSSIPGFDLEKVEDFIAFAAEHPNDVLLGLEARSIWEGYAGDSLAKIGPWTLAGTRIDKPTRDYSIQFGAWKEVCEAIGVRAAVDKIEPVEAALAAVNSCVTWAICINAAREGLHFDGLEVTARARVDPRVLLGVTPADEAISCMQKVELDIRVKGTLSQEDHARILEMAERSPVHALIKYENDIFTTVHSA